MLDFSAVNLDRLAIHKVGNKLQEEDIILSKDQVGIDENLAGLLIKYFLTPFKTDELYHFVHESDVNLNPVFNNAKQIFKSEQMFFEQTKHIAQQLYDSGNHPNIKGGEFYVIFLKDCIVGDEQTDAIGLFKSENKEVYIKIYPQGESFEISSEQGININKLDKGCLIFNSDENDGYKVCIVDKTNKSAEAQYWRQDFLGVETCPNQYFQTENYIKMCKGFVDDVYNEENNIDKPSQIDMLNRANDFFKEKKKFDMNDFAENVMMGESEVYDSFKDYKNNYEQKQNVVLDNEFEISKNAYKNAKKVFKSVLKLDKNFHVYIHGNRDYIIKGFDQETGLNFYQLFYEKEE